MSASLASRTIEDQAMKIYQAEEGSAKYVVIATVSNSIVSIRVDERCSVT